MHEAEAGSHACRRGKDADPEPNGADFEEDPDFGLELLGNDAVEGITARVNARCEVKVLDASCRHGDGAVDNVGLASFQHAKISC